MTFSPRASSWRNRFSCISLSVLSLALLAATPSLAATKSHNAPVSDDSDVAASPKAHGDAKKAKATSSHKSDDGATDEDDDAKAKSKTSTSKNAKAKTIKLADGDDGDAPAKTSKKATAGKSAKSKASDVADDDDAPAKSTKASKSKAVKLADADDDGDAPVTKTTKSAKGGKTVKLRSDKLASVDDDTDGDGDTAKAKAHAKSKKASELADADDSTTSHASRKSHAKSETAKADDEGVDIVRISAQFPHTAKGRRARAKAIAKARAEARAQRLANAALSAGLAKAAATMATPSQLALTKIHVTTAPPIAAPIPTAAPATLNSAPVPYTRIAAQLTPATPVANGVLSLQDAQLYQTAFTQIDQGDFTGAETTLAQVSDKSLMGYAEYHKINNRNYSATYDELIAWMGLYGDQPMAMKVWDLAKRKKPAGAPDPAFPQLMNHTAVASASGQPALSGAVTLATTTSLSDSAPPKTDVNPGTPAVDAGDSDLTPKSARSAYNNGQLEQAVVLADKIGDHWVAGLANWRLKRYDQALTEFKFVSTDPSANAWSQSSGAFWAGRCADKLGNGDQAQTFYKYAATFPFTFYGLVAEQKLGVTAAVTLAKKGKPPTYQPEERGVLTASLDDDFTWAKSNVQAQRLSALVQIGRTGDAQDEAQAAVQQTGDGKTRDQWLALAAYNHVEVSQLHGNDRLFDASIYPVPDIKLKGGYKIDRALLFAFARKESKFNPKARSYAGAYGLLQLMPGTAALVENDPSFNAKPDKLLQPATNMRVGQDYVVRLRDSKIVGGDLLRTIAAYNAGARPVKDATDSVGPEGDSLLVMESIPVAQTRQYVEEVAASYWIYRQILGHPSKTLAQAANGATIIEAAADD